MRNVTRTGVVVCVIVAVVLAVLEYQILSVLLFVVVFAWSLVTIIKTSQENKKRGAEYYEMLSAKAVDDLSFHEQIALDIKKGVFASEVFDKLSYPMKQKRLADCMSEYFIACCGESEGRAVCFEIDFEGAEIQIEEFCGNQRYFLDAYEDFETFNISAFYAALVNILRIRKLKYPDSDKEGLLETAFSLSKMNRVLFEDEVACGCFFCGQILNSKLIKKWTEGGIDDTGLCPYCGMDTVLPENCGVTVDRELLTDMHDYYVRLDRSGKMSHLFWTGIIKNTTES